MEFRECTLHFRSSYVLIGNESCWHITEEVRSSSSDQNLRAYSRYVVFLPIVNWHTCTVECKMQDNVLLNIVYFCLSGK